MGLTFEFVHNGEVLAISNEISQASSDNESGSIIIIATDDNFRKKIETALKEIAETKIGAQLLNTIFTELNNRKKTGKKTEFIIYPGDESKVYHKGDPYILGFNLNVVEFEGANGKGPGTPPLKAPYSTTLAHELEHIRQHLCEETGKMSQRCIAKNPKVGEIYETIEYCEVLAVEVENAVREELKQKYTDLELRTYYGGIEVYKEKGNKFKYYSGWRKGEKKENFVHDKNGIHGEEISNHTFKKLADKDLSDRFRFPDNYPSTIWAYFLKEKNEPNVTFTTSSDINIKFPDIFEEMKYRIERDIDGKKAVIPKNCKIKVIKRI